MGLQEAPGQTSCGALEGDEGRLRRAGLPPFAVVRFPHISMGRCDSLLPATRVHSMCGGSPIADHAAGEFSHRYRFWRWAATPGVTSGVRMRRLTPVVYAKEEE